MAYKVKNIFFFISILNKFLAAQILFFEFPIQIMFWFVCVFGVYRHTRDCFTHMETSPLPVKGYKFLPMLGIHGH